MGYHDLIRNILISSKISQFPWNFSHEGVVVFKLELWSETCLYHDSEQACELQSTASFGMTTTLRCTYSLLHEIPHIFLKWKNLVSIQHFSEFPPNTRHCLSVLAYILFFPVFHLFADLSSYFILADLAFPNDGNVFTSSFWSTAQPLLALKWRWILPPCAQEN